MTTKIYFLFFLIPGRFSFLSQNLRSPFYDIILGVFFKHINSPDVLSSTHTDTRRVRKRNVPFRWKRDDDSKDHGRLRCDCARGIRSNPPTSLSASSTASGTHRTHTTQFSRHTFTHTRPHAVRFYVIICPPVLCTTRKDITCYIVLCYHSSYLLLHIQLYTHLVSHYFPFFSFRAFIFAFGRFIWSLVEIAVDLALEFCLNKSAKCKFLN